MFHETKIAIDCYALMKKIPSGKVTTYKILADKLSTGPRVIGRICGQNPDIPATPCHRVVRSDGKIDGYALGTDKKIQLLKAEGLQIGENHKIINFQEKIWKFE